VKGAPEIKEKGVWSSRTLRTREDHGTQKLSTEDGVENRATLGTNRNTGEDLKKKKEKRALARTDLPIRRLRLDEGIHSVGSCGRLSLRMGEVKAYEADSFPLGASTGNSMVMGRTLGGWGDAILDIPPFRPTLPKLKI